uniref:Cuticular protein n=1 Tax=Nilaparvata lugens TaxID=108931 RepID=A0A2S1ZS44_NILLU|nr:cuticular protein [Nilaparvata lugens]
MATAMNVIRLAASLLALISTVSGQGQKNVQEDPCKVKSRVVADATYCDRYWECVNGQPELYDCPNGLVYAGKNRGVTEGCDYPWRANYCEDKTQANGPIGREHCDWLYGIFGHETSCTRYWTCWNGTATEQLCIGGLLYNENTHSCDWPENVDGCQKHPLCNDDANGNVPLGKSCNRYWQCQGGYPRLQRCPAMLVFDRRSLRCVVPPTEDCEVPTTPPPAPGEEEDGEQNLPVQPPKPINGRQQQNYQQPPPQQQQQQQQQQSQQQYRRSEDLPPNLPNLPQGAIPIPVRARARN